MKSLKEIHAAAKRFSPDDVGKQDAFIEGVRWATMGKFYTPGELFKDDGSAKHITICVEGRNAVIASPTFEEWWNAYNKKRGRKKAEAKWNKLSLQEKEACMKATPAYVASTPDVQYRLDPLTYLNGERWNDEIIQRPNYEQQHAISLASKAARILGSNHQG